MAHLLFALACSLLITIGSCVTQPFTHHASLDNTQVVTDPSTSSYCGGAIFSFDPSSGILTYTVVSNVEGTTVAHIHGPAYPGEEAGVIVTIPGFESGFNNTVTGAVTLSGSAVANLQLGLTYLNIHTDLYPNGEIRGQILGIGQTYTSLDGTQDGTDSTASGWLFASYDDDTYNLTTVLFHNVVNATSIHIHGPAPIGVAADVIFTLAGDAEAATSPIISYNILTDDQETDYYAGLYYGNIHTAEFPGGAIRGQLEAPVNYLGQLDGAQDGVVNSDLGVGLASLYEFTPGSFNLDTTIYHSVSDVTAAHIHQAAGPAPLAGGVEFAYVFVTTPISQNFTADSAEAGNITAGYDYFNIHTAADPGGHIRGQIYPKLAPGTSVTTTSTTATTTTTSTTGSGGATSSTHGTTSAGHIQAISSVALFVFAVFAVLL